MASPRPFPEPAPYDRRLPCLDSHRQPRLTLQPFSCPKLLSL